MSIRIFRNSTCWILCWFFCAPAAFAHHTFSMFDGSKSLSIDGTVTTVEFRYPHVWIWIAAPDNKGVDKVLGFEGVSPVELSRAGWTRSTLKAGDKVSVQYCPLRDGREGGSFSAITLPTGKVISGASFVCRKIPPVAPTPITAEQGTGSAAIK